MKIFITIFFFFLFVNSFAQKQFTDSVKLVQTLKEFHQALIKKNTVSINQQTDKALSYGHSNGWVETKTEMIENLKTGYIRYEKFVEDSIHISFNDKMANVRFSADIDASLKGVMAHYQLKVLEVWVKKGNRWVLFARQSVKS